MSSAYEILRLRPKRSRGRIPPPMSFKDIQARYYRELIVYLNGYRLAISSRLQAINPPRVRKDDWTDDIDRLFANLKASIERSKPVAKDLARAIATGVSTRNRTSFLRQMKHALGVDIFENAKTESIVKLAVQQNVALITSIPQKALGEVEQIAIENFKRGRRAEDFQDEIEDRFSVAESRAALIARDQVSKLNGSLSQERQTSVGIDHYFWRTSEDERVRPTHADLEGERIAWDDPPEETGHPGEDYNCRCHPEPDIDDIFAPEESEDES